METVLETSGILFSLKRFSIHDGPGIRTTVFMKGCPLSCEWCHNPEGQTVNPELLVSPHRCISCGSCTAVCQSGAVISCTDTDRSLCIVCGKCIEACFTDARMLAGMAMTASEVLKEISRDLPFYEDSGGGVTFSGGEPLTQPAFLYEMLSGCRDRGIHTCVDTCGYCEWEVLRDAALLTDLFLFDLKLLNDAAHIEHTGVSNGIILENLRRLSGIHDSVWIRVALIPGRTDSRENIEAIRSFVSTLDGLPEIDLLPYHDTWRGKLYRLGRTEQ
jgi:pyruvate formate lyase activating enzyme